MANYHAFANHHIIVLALPALSVGGANHKIIGGTYGSVEILFGPHLRFDQRRHAGRLPDCWLYKRLQELWKMPPRHNVSVIRLDESRAMAFHAFHQDRTDFAKPEFSQYPKFLKYPVYLGQWMNEFPRFVRIKLDYDNKSEKKQ